MGRLCLFWLVGFSRCSGNGAENHSFILLSGKKNRKKFEAFVENRTSDGTLNELLEDFERNVDRAFYKSVVFGDKYIVIKYGDFVYTYDRIQAAWIGTSHNLDNGVDSYHLYFMIDGAKVYMSKFELIYSYPPVKEKYDQICEFLKKKNPNIYFGEPTDN